MKSWASKSLEASIRDELDRATLLSRSSHHSAETLTRKVEELSEQVAEVASKVASIESSELPSSQTQLRANQNI